MPDRSAKALLKNIFGYDDFRGRQAEIIDHVAAGGNALAVMPTGAGKSLCFQIPALMKPGLAIVVSPLVSLMQNQVEALKLLGLEAETVNSHNTPEENREIWGKLRRGALKFLYLSPEKLMTPRMLEMVEGLEVNLFAIDEAHCISQWGAAFRPEYEGLSQLHRRFPRIPIIALTATADQATREQICEKIFSRDVTRFLTGFDRPNIRLGVEIKKGWKGQLLRFLAQRREEGGGQEENGIVYCLSRRKTEEAAEALCAAGYRALAYHAGMSNRQREENLNRFMAEPDLIMVATIAFGMGIDKPDIRFVFHTDLPASPEAYYQEIGRAGRDGQPAVAHMLYGMEDIRMRRLFIDEEQADEDHKRRGHQRLSALLAFCEAPECRRVSLLRYFGETADFDHCGNCDLCESPRETRDATEAGRKFLSAIYRTGERFGVAHIVDILAGKSTDRMTALGHDRLPTFGVGGEFDGAEWKSIARQLMARGLIVPDMQHGALKITEQGVLLLKGRETFRYRPDAVVQKKAAGHRRKFTAAPLPELSAEARELFQRLKEYRREIAAERGVPAYVIFSDKSLIDMAVRRPATREEFGAVYGVGAAKQQEFGESFLRLIRDNSPQESASLP